MNIDEIQQMSFGCFYLFLQLLVEQFMIMILPKNSIDAYNSRNISYIGFQNQLNTYIQLNHSLILYVKHVFPQFNHFFCR